MSSRYIDFLNEIIHEHLLIVVQDIVCINDTGYFKSIRTCLNYLLAIESIGFFPIHFTSLPSPLENY